jgi:hypothetical protein
MAAGVCESAFKSPDWRSAKCKQPLAILGGLSHRGGGKSMLPEVSGQRLKPNFIAAGYGMPEGIPDTNPNSEQDTFPDEVPMSRGHGRDVCAYCNKKGPTRVGPFEFSTVSELVGRGSFAGRLRDERSRPVALPAAGGREL